MTPAIRTALNDPAVSHWLKRALIHGCARDAWTAAHDAERLARLLRERFEFYTCGTAEAAIPEEIAP